MENVTTQPLLLSLWTTGSSLSSAWLGVFDTTSAVVGLIETTGPEPANTADSGCLKPQKGDFVPWDNPDMIITKQTEEVISLLIAVGLIPTLWAVGAVGNVLSAVVFYRQGLHVRINVCLFSLALADLASATVLFFSYLEAAYRQLVGPVNVFITYFIGLTGFTWVSQFLSVVIASERCFCVVFPLQAHRVLSARRMGMIIGVTSFILMAGLAAIAGHKHTMACVHDPYTNRTVDIVYVTKYYLDNQKILDIFDIFIYSTVFPIFFLVVIGVTSVVTAVKLAAARQWRNQTVFSIAGLGEANSGVKPPSQSVHKKVATSSSGNNNNNSSGGSGVGSGGGGGQLVAKDAAVTRMLLATNLLFIACLLPTIMVQISTFLVSELHYNGRYHNFVIVLWGLVSVCRVLNSSLNFFVYYAMGSKFRDTLRSLCPATCCK